MRFSNNQRLYYKFVEVIYDFWKILLKVPVWSTFSHYISNLFSSQVPWLYSSEKHLLRNSQISTKFRIGGQWKRMNQWQTLIMINFKKSMLSLLIVKDDRTRIYWKYEVFLRSKYQISHASSYQYLYQLLTYFKVASNSGPLPPPQLKGWRFPLAQRA